MLNKDAYLAAKNTCRSFGAFFQAVANEVGLDRTRELFVDADARQRRAPRIKRLLESKDINLEALAAQSEQGWYMMGFDSTTKATLTSLITTSITCPLYDGLLEAGIDHSIIESLCRYKDEVGDAQYKQSLGSYAGITMHKFRSGPDDVCIEETILKPSED